MAITVADGGCGVRVLTLAGEDCSGFLTTAALGQLASPSVPMTMRHRPPGSLALRVLKDDLAHAHDPDPDQR